MPDNKETIERQKFFDMIPEGMIVPVDFLYPPTEIRTSKSNKYLWKAVYGGFVPDHFDKEVDAHIYFAKKYLPQNDIVDITEETLQKFMNKILKYSSQNIPPKITMIDDKIEINWVRSTASLTKKQFSDYIENVKLFGREQGIEFESIENFKEE